MECCIMNLFCLNGYNGEKIRLDLNEVIGFPNNTSIEGGYDIICTLVIDSGCYHIEHDRLYSAIGSGEYHCLYENDLTFKVEMTNGGHAIVTGVFQERPNKQNVLQFEFDTDQSRLLSVIQDIESLKVKYGGMEGLRNK